MAAIRSTFRSGWTAIETRAPTLTLYGRSRCHLCDEMKAGLDALRARFEFELNVVDIDGDPRLVVRYGRDVPVLVHGERELCRHALDLGRVTDHLSKIG